MNPALLLAAVLREPERAERLPAPEWTALFAVARAEQLIGTLAYRIRGLRMPPAAQRLVEDAITSAEQGRAAALWEAEMARRALAASGMPVVLLKGTAYAAAGLSPSTGRAIGDLDILVPRARIEEAEAAALELELAIGAPPQVASLTYLDEIGAATRALELALGEHSSPFASAVAASAGVVESFVREVEMRYKLPLR